MLDMNCFMPYMGLGKKKVCETSLYERILNNSRVVYSVCGGTAPAGVVATPPLLHLRGADCDHACFAGQLMR